MCRRDVGAHTDAEPGRTEGAAERPLALDGATATTSGEPRSHQTPAAAAPEPRWGSLPRDRREVPPGASSRGPRGSPGVGDTERGPHAQTADTTVPQLSRGSRPPSRGL